MGHITHHTLATMRGGTTQSIQSRVMQLPHWDRPSCVLEGGNITGQPERALRSVNIPFLDSSHAKLWLLPQLINKRISLVLSTMLAIHRHRDSMSQGTMHATRRDKVYSS